MALIIDGTPALVSGSVMVPPGVTAGIRTPGGTIDLRFAVVGEPGFSWDHWTLTITAPENPLGIGFEVPLTQDDGSTIVLAITVHTVGQGANVHRIVHYSGYRRR